MEHQEFWQKIEAALWNYERTYTPMRWFGHWGGLTKGRRGQFIFLRFIFIAGLYVAAFSLPLHAWSRIFLTFIACYLIIDMFMLPTSIAFGGLAPMRPLRALVFLLCNYISISIAFGLLYITLCRSSFNIDPDLIDLAYFSFTTMTTLGLGDILPARHTILVRFLVVSEVLIGLYFWAVLVGMIIAWTARETGKEKISPQ
jgi:hypothetical protein